jgi:hypothetical protein
VPDDVASAATVNLSGGVPFLSDDDVEAALDDSGVPEATAQAALDENTSARLAGLRAALAVLAVIAAIATFLTRLLPRRPVGADSGGGEPG